MPRASAKTVPPAPPSARQRRKEARPQELLEAALSLFVEKGFAATRSEEVAARDQGPLERIERTAGDLAVSHDPLEAAPPRPSSYRAAAAVSPSRYS